MKNFLFSGKVIDLSTGKQIHKTNAKSMDEFDDMFTKPMRAK